jgi:hypothetical protein
LKNRTVFPQIYTDDIIGKGIFENGNQLSILAGVHTFLNKRCILCTQMRPGLYCIELEQWTTKEKRETTLDFQ